MNQLKLEDEWHDSPYAIREAFIDAMRKSTNRKGNPSEEITLKDLPVGAEVIIRENIKG